MLLNFEKFTYNINAVGLYWHRIASAEMKQHGLKGSSAIYFINLYSHPEGLSAAELAGICAKDKADVSREIAKLEKAGLMQRASSDKRGYRVPIVLTAKGREYAMAITAKAKRATDIVDAALTEEEAENFRIAFEKIEEALKKLCEEDF